MLLFVERVEAYHAIQREIEERRRHRGCYGRDGRRVDFKGKVLIVQRQSERLDRRSSIAIGKIERNFRIDWSRRPINRSFTNTCSSTSSLRRYYLVWKRLLATNAPTHHTGCLQLVFSRIFYHSRHSLLPVRSFLYGASWRSDYGRC